MGGDSWMKWRSAGSRYSRIGIPVLTCVLSVLAFPGAALAQEEAESSAETAEQAREITHEVRRGDTLWGLAGTFLADPLLWPRIFEINTDVVEDPHWIYPGEILAMPGLFMTQAPADGAAVAIEPLESWDAAREQAARAQDPGQAARRGVSVFGGTSLFDESPDMGNVVGTLEVDMYREPVLVSESDFYRAPLLVGQDEIRYTGRTVRKMEGNPLGLRIPAGVRLFDLVIIELDRLDVVAGDELRAIHVESGPNGRQIARSVALLEVLEADDRQARARVTRLYGDYQVGDVVILAEGFDVSPTMGQALDRDGLKTHVIAPEVEQAIIGENEMVFLAAGEASGVRIGDEFALFDVRDDANARTDDRLATVRIIRVTAETSTGRIVDLRDTSPEAGSPARRILRAVGN